MNKPTKPNRQGLDDYVLTNQQGLYMSELIDTSGIDGTNNVITVCNPHLHYAYIYRGISSKTAKQLGDEFNLIPVKYKDELEKINQLPNQECIDGFCFTNTSNPKPNKITFTPIDSKSVDRKYTLGK